MEARLPADGVDQGELRDFFIEHLNRLYCAKDKMAAQLPLLGNQAGFLDLKEAVSETVEEILMQLQRIRQIFIRMDTVYQSTSCGGMAGILDEAFQSVGPQLKSRKLRDLSILFYMQNIESIEVACFKILKLTAAAMEDRQIVQLLAECYDEAREDTALYREITKHYIRKA